jgi:hypothetical protein
MLQLHTNDGKTKGRELVAPILLILRSFIFLVVGLSRHRDTHVIAPMAGKFLAYAGTVTLTGRLQRPTCASFKR